MCSHRAGSTRVHRVPHAPMAFMPEENMVESEPRRLFIADIDYLALAAILTFTIARPKSPIRQDRKRAAAIVAPRVAVADSGVHPCGPMAWSAPVRGDIVEVVGQRLATVSRNCPQPSCARKTSFGLRGEKRYLGPEGTVGAHITPGAEAFDQAVGLLIRFRAIRHPLDRLRLGLIAGGATHDVSGPPRLPSPGRSIRNHVCGPGRTAAYRELVPDDSSEFNKFWTTAQWPTSPSSSSVLGFGHAA